MTRIRPAERWIVRTPSWLGDFVMAEPALRAMYRRVVLECGGELTLLGPGAWLELIAERFEGAVRIPLARGEREAPAAYRGQDGALFLNGSTRSVLCAWRAGVRERVGWSGGGRRAWLSCAYGPALERGGVPLGLGRAGRAPRRLPRPFGSACAELVAWLGAPVFDTHPELSVDPAARECAEISLNRAGIDAGEAFVLLNVASRPDSAKAAPPELWSELAADTELPLVYHAAPGEEAAVDALSTAHRIEPAPTLPELLALLERASLYVTADGGPRHLAVALDRPLVVLFGPTDPRHTADHLARTRSLRHEVDCGPCHREHCPLEGPARHACMTGIDARAVAALLQSQSSPKTRSWKAGSKRAATS